MPRTLEIRREDELTVTPEDYWDAITTGNAAWLWPMEFEPRQGGAAAFGGIVTVWDPPAHFVTRVQGDDGWFNQVEHIITRTRDGGVHFVYVHSGVFLDDWDNQYDGASQHTDFYIHTLCQYLRHYNGRPVTYASADAPAESSTPRGFDAVRSAFGITPATKRNDTLRVTLPSAGEVSVIADCLEPNFIGLRTADAMYRFFGRNAFGAPVGIAVHDFAPSADPEALAAAWRTWLNELYA